MQRAQANHQMQQGMQLFQRRQFDQAVNTLTPLLRLAPNNPNLLYAIAVSLRHLGRHAQSERQFDTLIKAQKHPAFYNAYAGLHADLRRYDQAIALLQRALKLDAGYFDAHYNLGRYAQADAQYQLGLDGYDGALARQPNHPGARLGKAQCLLALKRNNEAEAFLLACLAQQGDALNLRYLLGELYRQSDRLEAAKTAFERCLEKAPSHRHSLLGLAAVVGQQGERAQAQKLYRQLISKDALDIEAHDGLFQLGWLGGEADYFTDYERACSAHPDSILVLHFAKKLIREGQLAEARTRLSRFLQAHPDHSDARVMLGHAVRELGEFDAALEILAGVTDAQHCEYLWEKAVTLLCLEQANQALECAQTLVDRYPTKQGYWALYGTCLKLAGKDEAYRALYDFDALVCCVQVSDDAATFNAGLLEELDAIHRSARAPIDQSLRTGSQTQGELFDTQGPQVQALKARIDPHIQGYFDALARKEGHPLMGQTHHPHQYTGSWSVKLASGGHHVNHFHSEGSISACYYVVVPDAANREGQGWFQLGQPELSRWLKLEPDYCIKPAPGTMVIFPSYMWHGTRPVKETAERITVAFDVSSRLR
ncbi:tetratricopeptide repeat protein [Ferrimonas balearica]|uniref:tetratricopeptide repeat protein n=1 Tax=Ferrimonas balearica TaxID=44012 RepID=UPI001C9A0D09|nr:tetratricopeptide repeat protein [Ferrimonas balearica]MBY5990844.1 tetratricopeptide repeat protein [Ferrimonas balearica]